MAKAKTKARKAKPTRSKAKPKPKIKGYDIVAVQQYAKILPGEILPLYVDCPNGKVILGGGAESQFVPGDSPYSLKSSWPIRVSTGGSKWGAVWTNTTNYVPTTAMAFTVYVIVADA